MDAIHLKPPACILLDIFLPGLSGIQILERLRNKGTVAPTVVVSGNREISRVVEALRLGAVDYVEKPFSGEDLLARVEEAIRTSSTTEEAPEIPASLPGSGKLTRREREVLEHTVLGKSAKQIAVALRLSSRTVEDHRANLLRKAGARNLPELVLKVMTAGRREG
jgi:FixJ family two-component response regulator